MSFDLDTEEQFAEGQSTSKIKQSWQEQSWKGYAFALLAALCWSIGGLTAKHLELEPGVMTGVRSLVAAVVLGIILLFAKRDAFKVANPRRDIPFLIFFGIFAQSGMQYTYLQAIAHNRVGVAILLEYLAPVFSLLFGLVLFRHKPRLMAVVGVGIALIGCALVVGVANPAGLTVTPIGLAWGIASAFFFSLYSVAGGHVKERYASLTLLFYGMAVSAVLWTIISGPTAIIAPFISIETLLPVLAVGSIATLLPFGAFLLALRYIPPVNAGITAMAEPILAAIGGAVFFSEALTGSFIVGGILILVAIATIQISDAWQS